MSIDLYIYTKEPQIIGCKALRLGLGSRGWDTVVIRDIEAGRVDVSDGEVQDGDVILAWQRSLPNAPLLKTLSSPYNEEAMMVHEAFIGGCTIYWSRGNKLDTPEYAEELERLAKALTPRQLATVQYPLVSYDVSLNGRNRPSFELAIDLWHVIAVLTDGLLYDPGEGAFCFAGEKPRYPWGKPDGARWTGQSSSTARMASYLAKAGEFCSNVWATLIGNRK